MKMARAVSRVRSQLPGQRTDVTRLEHENLTREVTANSQRIEQLDALVRRLVDDVAELKKLLIHQRLTRGAPVSRQS
jgi:uncharacterized protein YigA (DUF484 family)